MEKEATNGTFQERGGGGGIAIVSITLQEIKKKAKRRVIGDRWQWESKKPPNNPTGENNFTESHAQRGERKKYTWRGDAGGQLKKFSHPGYKKRGMTFRNKKRRETEKIEMVLAKGEVLHPGGMLTTDKPTHPKTN